MLKLFVCTNVPLLSITIARSPHHAWAQLKAVLEGKGWNQPAPKQVGVQVVGTGDDATSHPVYLEWTPTWKVFDCDQPGAYIVGDRVHA